MAGHTLVDIILSEHRDLAAVKASFLSAGRRHPQD
jgi:hypothetical protein